MAELAELHKPSLPPLAIPLGSSKKKLPAFASPNSARLSTATARWKRPRIRLVPSQKTSR